MRDISISKVIDQIELGFKGYMLYWTITKRRLIKINGDIKEQLSSLDLLVEARIFNVNKEYHIKLIGSDYEILLKDYNANSPNLIEYQVLDDSLSRNAIDITGYNNDLNIGIQIIKEVVYDELGQAFIKSSRLSEITTYQDKS